MVSWDANFLILKMHFLRPDAHLFFCFSLAGLGIKHLINMFYPMQLSIVEQSIENQ